ncbi:MAG TPA: alpha/beta hydrolase [Sphingomonas sp.]|nr:alpha/beta hydrolase [Sphingomonas sp.]
MLRSETAAAPERTAAALDGLAAYQQAPRPAPPPPRPVVARAGRARLLDYGEGTGGRPLVIAPSLINGPDILDLLPELSMLRWLAQQNVRPLLVDWGEPQPGESGLSIAGHVETMLLPLLDAAGRDAALAGYCLGGTMALAAAMLRPPRSLALIAAPWRFAGFPADSREGLAALWAEARPIGERLGLLPLEVLQTAFWRLDPKRTVDKFVAFGRAERDAAATRRFVAIEDWANGGAPLTLEAGRELVEELFGRDATGSGRWRVGGEAIDSARLACPVLDIVSTTDRIVPAASAAGVGRRLTLAQGHVGMVVGGRARESLWRPLAEWVANPHIG